MKKINNTELDDYFAMFCEAGKLKKRWGYSSLFSFTNYAKLDELLSRQEDEHGQYAISDESMRMLEYLQGEHAETIVAAYLARYRGPIGRIIFKLHKLRHFFKFWVCYTWALITKRTQL